MPDPPGGWAAREDVLSAREVAPGTIEAAVATEQRLVPACKPNLSLPGGGQ
jgi:hypothetical protein